MILQRKKMTVLFFLMMSTMLIFGCSSKPYIQEIPITAKVVEEISDLKSNLSFATQDQADVLSPRNFKEASEQLEKAEKSLSKQNESKETLKYVALGNAYLKRANEIQKLSNNKMEEVVIARKEALQSGAMTTFEKDFKEADEELVDVTSDLEKNDMKSADKHRSALQKNYRDLELRGIKYSNLNPSEVIIKRSIVEGSSKIAPQSLAIAQKSLQDTDAYITANRHNTEEIRIQSQSVYQNANHVMKITNDSKKAKNTSPEELALQLERRDKEIVTANDNFTNEKVATGQLSQENDLLKDDVVSKQSALDDSAAITTGLSQENFTLQSEKDLNDKFEAAQKLFSKNEAEVYKQGRTLTIRLRGLEFPSSGAKLKKSNAPLLDKVQSVIKDFDSKSIVVEGHTDSVGSEASNDKLSEVRAQAVRNYLIENGSTNEENITSVGQGFKKPLATNKSAKGRAQNRRVDVLISL